MGKTVLITGGAGFIGSHVADELLRHGYRVRALDSLIPQVHGPERTRPDYLHRDVELLVGDIRDPELVDRALIGVDAVYHFAARVGVGQSMYEVRAYTDVNNLGTAVLLEALSKRPLERLVVASSMSIYGEGPYVDRDGRVHENVNRTLEQLRAGRWEPRDEQDRPLEPLPVPETKQPYFSSVYALSKYDQERTCLMLGQAYGIPTVALRFFNVYGTRQALSNPYTGVLAIFASRILNGKPPLIFEDGGQRRDFVNYRDVAKACRLALEVPDAKGHIFNVGSGRTHTIRAIARQMAETMGRPDIEPQITQDYRVGDVRHCFPDVSAARTILGFEPEVDLATGLAELSTWLEGQVAVDRVEEMHRELSSRGLTLRAG
ncbi:NAD-dependent epimerase/dehydratase family protein [Myxococcota bacterium]|nr:NAD-dependent epimerase/dehydratase family protein [Myxococcota bacterium]